MPRPRRSEIEVLTNIVEKRQPLSLRDVRYFARCFVAMSEWTKDEMYAVIRDNFYVDENNNAIYNTIYKKSTTGQVSRKKPSKYLISYLDGQGVNLDDNVIKVDENDTTFKDPSDVSVEPKKVDDVEVILE